MLSSTTRLLTRITAASYLFLGVVLFGAPGWGTDKFAWSVSPFLLMTIGAWCLGNAAFAWQSARVWRWPLVRSALIYLWTFGLFEAAVMFAFRDKVNLGTALSSGYAAAIGINVITALVGMYDLLRLRPAAVMDGTPLPVYVRVLTILFVISLAVIALGGLFAQPGGLSTEGGLFPEPLTLFSVRAFAVFFAAVGLSALPLIWARSLSQMAVFGRAGLVLIVPILIAAFVNLDKFDFGARPGGMIYIGIYVITLAIVAWGLWHFRAAFSAPQETV